MSCKKCANECGIVVKPGDDIKWAGFLEQYNITDFTGYVLAAEFRAKNMNSKEPGTLLGTGTIEWVDEPAGLFHVIVDRAVTVLWPKDITVMMDISVTDVDDHRVRTETLEFKTTTGVTESM